MPANYRPELIERVNAIRNGIEPQPFATLSVVSPFIRKDTAKYRRILCRRVYPGDIPYIEQLEKAKSKLNELQADVAR